MPTTHRFRSSSTVRTLCTLTAAGAMALALAACGDQQESASAPKPTGEDAISLLFTSNSPRVRYGPSTAVGNGHVRTYVILDETLRRPTEVGVAMDESALDGLPSVQPMEGMEGTGGHAAGLPGMYVYDLDMPREHNSPYQFVELDWNAMGHEPPGIYDVPHFDFHFYTASKTLRNSILPSDPQYGQKAATFPDPSFMAPFYIDPVTASGGAPAAAVAVPKMGMHWLDVRAPELQGALGNPAGYKPFTRTFIYGTWDGQVTFDEPMITRAFILSKKGEPNAALRNEITPVPVAARYSPAGYYPSAYRVGYDPGAKEYRIALTQLSYHN